MMSLHTQADDDADFVEVVRALLLGCVKNSRPAEVYVIHVRDYFDPKWCYFSGKTLGALGVSKFKTLTLPPFVPNRVLTQKHYRQDEDRKMGYRESEAAPLHIHQPSDENFRRHLRRTTNDGLLCWYSSGSVDSQRGSVMVYQVDPKLKWGWHVTYEKREGWRLDRATWIPKTSVEKLSALGRELVESSG